MTFFYSLFILALAVTQSHAGGAISTQRGHPFPPTLLSPDLEVVNVVSPQFGNGSFGGDYGLANTVPVEIGNDVGRGWVIRIVRTPELRPSGRDGIRFRVRLGDVSNVYLWIETPSANEVWAFDLSVTYFDGYQKSTLSENVQRQAEYNVQAAPRATLDFEIHPTAHPFALGKYVSFTISPVRLLVWSEQLVPRPSTVERGIINP